MNLILTTESEDLEVNACETVKQVIQSDDFKRIFIICLRKMKNIEHNYYISIFEKILCLGKISGEETMDLLSLLENNDFEEIYSSYFNTKVTFKGNNELLSQFKENISLIEIKKYIKEIVLSASIDGVKDQISNSINSTIDNPLAKTIKIGNEIFISYECLGKGKVLLNQKGEQISPFEQYFKDFDFEYYTSTKGIIGKQEGGIITVFLSDGKTIGEFKKLNFDQINIQRKAIRLIFETIIEIPDGYITAIPNVEKHWNKHDEKILLSLEWKQVNQNKAGDFDFSYFDKGFIISQDQGCFEVTPLTSILNKYGEIICDGYYTFNFTYYNKVGFIIATKIGKGEVLLNKKGEQISPEGEYYEQIFYDESNNKFYSKGKFGFKKYIKIGEAIMSK